MEHTAVSSARVQDLQWLTRLRSHAPAYVKDTLLHRFPVNSVITQPGFDRFAVRSFWVLIPLQYYVLTTLPAGFSDDAYIACAAVALGVVLIFMASSGAVGAVYPKRPDGDNTYAERVRSLMIATLLVWSASLILLSCSYAVTSVRSKPVDLIETILCGRHQFQMSCIDHPDVRLTSFVIYGVYASLAAGILMGLFWALTWWRIRKKLRSTQQVASPDSPPATENSANALPGPHVLLVVTLVTGVMTLMHTAATMAWPRFAQILN
jgi:hypothetical protein